MNQKTLLLITLLFLVFIFNSCKKKNAVQEEMVQPDTEKFFQIAANVSPQLKAVVNDIKNQNDIYKFVPVFSKRNGFPVWDKAISNLNILDTSATNSNAIFFIPLKIPDGDISSYIVCLKNDSGYRYKLYTRAVLENALSVTNDEDSLKDLLNETMIIGFFEKSINGKDSVLFAENYFKKITISIHGKEKPLPGARAEGDGYWDTQVVTTCFYVNGGNKKIAQDYNTKVSALGINSTQACYDRLTTVWVGPTGSGGGGTTGGGGGSGGGGITGNYQCSPQQWWCESGAYRIVKGRLYTPDYYPGKNKALPWLWWETPANYQNWLNYDINIINDLSTSLALTRNDVFELVAKPAEADELRHLLDENNYSQAARTAAKTVIQLSAINQLNGPYDDRCKNVLLNNLPSNLTQVPNFSDIASRDLPTAILYKSSINNGASSTSILFSLLVDWINQGKFAVKVLSDGTLSVYNNDVFWNKVKNFSDQLNTSGNIHELSTNALRNICINRGWANGVTPLEFNRRVGKAFEETALSFFGLYENRLNYEAPLRAAKNSPTPPTKVRPDGLDNIYFQWFDRNGTSKMDQLQKSFATEVKAYAGRLELSSNNWQILGELEILKNSVDNQANSPYWQQLFNPPFNITTWKLGPILFFITTGDTEIGQSIIDEARNLKISVWQVKALYDDRTFKTSFGDIKFIYDKSNAYAKFENVPRDFFQAVVKGMFVNGIGSSEVPVNLFTPVQPNFDLDPEEIK